MATQKLGGEKRTSQKQFEQACQVDRDLRDALTRVLDRMGTKSETLEEAAEVVADDYGGSHFRENLIRYARGQS